MPQKTLRDSWLFICDSTSVKGAEDLLDLNVHSLAYGSNWIAVKIGEGNISWTEARTVTYKRDRGRLTQVDGTVEVFIGEAIAGDEQPMEVSFDIVFESYHNPNASGAGPVEAIKGVNAATVYPSGASKPTQIVDGNAACEIGNWGNADTVDSCAPWAVNLLMQFQPECGTGTEVLWFPRFRWDSLQFNISEGTIACTGKCTALKPLKVLSSGWGSDSTEWDVN
jgi:hypothetical protein